MSDEIETARAAVKHAEQRLADLRVTMAEAEGALHAARERLQAARVRRDEALPQAVMVTHHRWSVGNSRTVVVVLKRTAKTITARRVGSEHDMTFRQGRDGKWREYPRPASLGYLRYTLELPE